MAEDVSLPTTSSTAAAAVPQLANDATRGWAQLQRVVNVTLPQILNRCDALNKQTMRLLRG